MDLVREIVESVENEHTKACAKKGFKLINQEVERIKDIKMEK